MFAGVDTGTAYSSLCAVIARPGGERFRIRLSSGRQFSHSHSSADTGRGQPSRPSSRCGKKERFVVLRNELDREIFGWFLRDPWDGIVLMLNGARLKERVKELRSEFDYVLIDAPPLTPTPMGWF